MHTANDNHMMYDSRDIQYGARQTEFFFTLDYFLPFYHTIDPKIKIRKKIKKSPGDIILLHMCSYEDHIICSFWNIRHDRQGFLSFWAIFSPLTILTTWTIKILKKWKTWQEVLSFYTCVPQMMIIHYTVPEIRSMRNWIFYFGLFLPFYPLSTWKIKILKKWKKDWRYHHFTLVYHKWQSYDVWFLRNEARQTEFFAIFGHSLPF